MLDIQVDGFDDKPWRKPGTDITDYFNYGFNEETWKAYMNKQRQVREHLTVSRNAGVDVFQFMPMRGPGGQMMMQHPGSQMGMGMQGRPPLPIRTVNAGGKRLRAQDDSVISVLAGGKDKP